MDYATAQQHDSNAATDATDTFSLLVKPASADCNLSCAYCFYLDRASLYPDQRVHRMNDRTLERLIASYMATPRDLYAFGWQGGEPTLMGLSFFQRVTQLQTQYGGSGAVVTNGIQTNGAAIDPALARHLARYAFLAGVSIDGPSEIHDCYRTTPHGAGSHAAVMRGLDCLRRGGVQTNALTLVTAASAHRARDIYQFLCEHSLEFHQYIPCVEFDAHGSPMPWTVTGEQWGEFLCTLFDQWYAGDVRKVSVRLFDALLSYLVDNQYSICQMDRQCDSYLVVEHNGDVYPCDFYVEAPLKLGSIQTHSWSDMRRSERYRRFCRQKSALPAACHRCPYLALCHGDCPRRRQDTKRGGDRPWLCAGWTRFFRHSRAGFKRLAAKIREERARAAEAAQCGSPSGPPGRNDPCPCGSGFKFKRCCGRA
jgi:uncharacterized protein